MAKEERRPVTANFRSRPRTDIDTGHVAFDDDEDAANRQAWLHEKEQLLPPVSRRQDKAPVSFWQCCITPPAAQTTETVVQLPAAGKFSFDGLEVPDTFGAALTEALQTIAQAHGSEVLVLREQIRHLQEETVQRRQVGFESKPERSQEDKHASLTEIDLDKGEKHGSSLQTPKQGDHPRRVSSAPSITSRGIVDSADLDSTHGTKTFPFLLSTSVFPAGAISDQLSHRESSDILSSYPSGRGYDSVVMDDNLISPSATQQTQRTRVEQSRRSSDISFECNRLKPSVDDWRRVVYKVLTLAGKDMQYVKGCWEMSEGFVGKARRHQKDVRNFTNKIHYLALGGPALAFRWTTTASGQPGSYSLHSRMMNEVSRQYTSRTSRQFSRQYNSRQYGRANTSASSTMAVDQQKMEFLAHERDLKRKKKMGRQSKESVHRGYWSRMLVMDPQSAGRIFWMFMGIFLMLYDLVMLPVQAVFEVEENPGVNAMSWIVQCFWTVDIVLCFFTGVFVRSELEMRLHVIVRNYLMGWFPIDLAVTAPMWVILVFGWDTKAASSLKSAKYFRMLRFLRLCRLAKFETLLREVLDFINSSAVMLSIGIFKQMVSMVLVNHVVACLWYAVGKERGTRGNDPQLILEGWALKAYIAQGSIFYKYLCAIHWTLTQFQGTSDIEPGQTDGERAYAVVTVVFALIGFACFVSSLTNQMMQLQSLHAHKTREQRIVRGYLSEHHISYGLSVRVKRYLEWKQRLRQSQEYDQKIRDILPKPLLMDLLEEVRSPYLVGHLFFGAFMVCFPRLLRRVIFEGLDQTSPAPGEVVFGACDTCLCMYFVVSGQLQYKVMPALHRFSLLRKTETDETAADIPIVEVPITKDAYLCEQQLWTTWEHTGDLTCQSDSMMLQLADTRLAEITKCNPPAFASAVIYARRFVCALNQFGKNYTDHITPDELQDMLMVTEFVDMPGVLKSDSDGSTLDITYSLLSKISKPSKQVVSDPTTSQAFRDGDAVIAIDSFETESPTFQIPVNGRGLIVEVDGEGDALIQFEGKPPAWVFKTKFCHMEKDGQPASRIGRDLSRGAVRKSSGERPSSYSSGNRSSGKISAISTSSDINFRGRRSQASYDESMQVYAYSPESHDIYLTRSNLISQGALPSQLGDSFSLAPLVSSSSNGLTFHKDQPSKRNDVGSTLFGTASNSNKVSRVAI